MAICCCLQYIGGPIKGNEDDTHKYQVLVLFVVYEYCNHIWCHGENATPGGKYDGAQLVMNTYIIVNIDGCLDDGYSSSNSTIYD